MAGNEFRYKEVASRCRGRIDIRHRFDSEPFKSLSDSGGWMPTVHASLEGDCQLQYAGLVLSLPGSDDQGWHTDGEHLFPGFGHHTPPHAVTVFVPLVNLTEANGCPQFFVGSHVEAVATALSEGTETDPPVTAELSTGSALIFDYRLVHRGTGNSTAGMMTRSCSPARRGNAAADSSHGNTDTCRASVSPDDMSRGR